MKFNVTWIKAWKVCVCGSVSGGGCGAGGGEGMFHVNRNSMFVAYVGISMMHSRYSQCLSTEGYVIVSSWFSDPQFQKMMSWMVLWCHMLQPDFLQSTEWSSFVSFQYVESLRNESIHWVFKFIVIEVILKLNPHCGCQSFAEIWVGRIKSAKSWFQLQWWPWWIFKMIFFHLGRTEVNSFDRTFEVQFCCAFILSTLEKLP